MRDNSIHKQTLNGIRMRNNKNLSILIMNQKIESAFKKKESVTIVTDRTVFINKCR